MDKKENNRELRVLIFGEAAVAVLTVAGAFLVSLFSEYVFGFSAVTGALLGALIVVLNFAFLSLSVNRAVDEYLAVRGSREMTDEEAGL
jgi:cobalamin biosynthesis protein CobD/CbiB